MKYYIRKTSTDDILLLTLDNNKKSDIHDYMYFKIESVLQKGRGYFPSNSYTYYRAKEITEFNSMEEAIGWATLEML